jgi:predicted DNA-binding transcriptional regulator YafY
MGVGATQRLSRLLAMVPWLLRQQGVSLARAAGHFGITEQQLVKDLQLLFVCGTPGHLPDDLIEADWESGYVFLGNAPGLSRPLRLGVDEAVALLVGLRTLAEIPGLHDRDAVESALVKISAAAGDARATADNLAVDLTPGVCESTLTLIRGALRTRTRLHLRYLVPSRDETTERDISPMRLACFDGGWYLEGWCHEAEAVRLFRLDRVVELNLLDQDGTPPREAVRRDTADGLFVPSPDDTVVTLDLAPGAHWVAEYYPVEGVRELPGEVLRVRLRTSWPDWVPRLALRLGGQAHVVTPEHLAERAGDLAARALLAYGEQDPAGCGPHGLEQT